jgi:hypothetical protein
MSASITSQARRGLRWISLPSDVTPDALSHVAGWPAFVTPMPPLSPTGEGIWIEPVQAYTQEYAL